MKELFRISFPLILFGILCIVGIPFLFYTCKSNNKAFQQYEKADSTMKSNIGKRIVIKNDTFVLVDYSAFKNEYKLNNGTTVNSEMLKNGNLIGY